MKQTVKLDISADSLALHVKAATQDARFPLFEHLFDVHKWDTVKAYNYTNTDEGKRKILGRCCPICGKTISTIVLADA